MATMKEVCNRINISYDTLKYYCNEGLVPNHQRDKNNHRIFSEKDIMWLEGLMCLRACGMSINGMRSYMLLCQKGPSSIPKRKEMLFSTYEELTHRKDEIMASLRYIEEKQHYYNKVLSGELEYKSSLDLS